jgi:hypothetical protein
MEIKTDTLRTSTELHFESRAIFQLKDPQQFPALCRRDLHKMGFYLGGDISLGPLSYIGEQYHLPMVTRHPEQVAIVCSVVNEVEAELQAMVATRNALAMLKEA